MNHEWLVTPRRPSNRGSTIVTMAHVTKHLMKLTAAAALGVMIPAAASAACSISGTISASPNPNPSGPAWMYTAVIDWDTGTRYALSHIDMLLDVAGGGCTCQNFRDAISWGPTIGTSGTSCVTAYGGELNCQGDPSIPGVLGIALKLNPMSGSCEPGTTGQGTYVFYSNLGPAAIDEEALTLIDKFGRLSCYGHLAGDFPAMPCGPVAETPAAWGSVKGLYR